MPVIAIFTHTTDRTVRPPHWYLYHHGVAIAWAGGAAFVVSLLYLSYFFLVTLGSSAGDPSTISRAVGIDVLLFAAFALHHSVLARSGVKRLVSRMIGARFERAAYVWIASLLAIAMCALWQPVAGLMYSMHGWWPLPLWALQAFGAGFIISAVRVIDPLELAGIRQAAGQAATGSLKIVGPFRIVRHPIYLGWMLLVFSAPTMTANRLLFAAMSSLYLILAIPWEESSLVEGHGDRYRDYQRLVPWRVIPGIW